MTFASIFYRLRPRRPFGSAFAMLLAIAALALFSGCATTPTARGSRLVVKGPSAEFYRNGPAQDSSFSFESTASIPAQTSGPDFQLLRGAAVTMVRKEFGYSQVMTEAGDLGYVANEQLQPAPPIPIQRVTQLTPKREPRSRDRKRDSSSSPRPAIEEQLDLSDIPLPLPS